MTYSSTRFQNEMAVIAFVLYDPDNGPEAIRSLTPEMFTVAEHREVFMAISRLEAGGKLSDTSAVIAELQKTEEAEIQSGREWRDTTTRVLQYCEDMELVVGLGSLSVHIDAIRESWQRRELAARATEIATRALNPAENPQDLAPFVDSLSGVLDDGAIAMSDPLIATQRANDALSYAIEHGEVMGYKSGHWLFDRNSLGFVEGSIGVEAADTGGGKTHNLWHRCRTFTRINQVNAGLISGEMTEDELIQRQVIGDRNLALAASGKMEPHAEQAIRKRLQEYAKTPTEVIRPPSMALNDVLAATRLLARRRQCKLICIDYAQMIHVKGERDPNEAARRVYGELKDLAMRLGIAILIASQFNKQGRREQSKHSPMAITEQDIYGSSHASFYAHTISHTIRLSHALHDDRMRRVADKLRDLGVDPMTVTIERILKSRRGQKQRYTMASEFKGWAMRPLDAEKHRAIRDLMNTPGDTNADTPTDPAEHFMRSSQPSADTTANGFKATF